MITMLLPQGRSLRLTPGHNQLSPNYHGLLGLVWFFKTESGGFHGHDRSDASHSKKPVSRLSRHASRHDRAMSRCIVGQQRSSQPVLADRLSRAVLHAFLPPAECGFVSSMGTSPDWNSVHGRPGAPAVTCEYRRTAASS